MYIPHASVRIGFFFLIKWTDILLLINRVSRQVWLTPIFINSSKILSVVLCDFEPQTVDYTIPYIMDNVFSKSVLIEVPIATYINKPLVI